MSIFELLILSGTILYLAYKYGTEFYDHWDRKGINYLKPSFPFIGNSWDLILKKISAAENLIRVYNEFPGQRFGGLFMFRRPILLLKDPEIIRNVMVKDFEHFFNRALLIDPNADPLFGKNLSVLKDQQWKDMRTTLTPMFTSAKMKNMLTLINTIGRQMTDYLDRMMTEQVKSKNSDEILLTFEFKDFFRRFTIDVIATCAFGVEIDSLKDRENQFYKMGVNVVNLTGIVFVKYILCFMFPTLVKIRKLQEKEQSNGNFKPNLLKMGGKPGKLAEVPEKEDQSIQESNQTIEDLKAIDEDIEKLRKQIEERDKIISALREAAEAKDKKLDNLMLEYSKLQSGGKLELDTSPEPNRATSSSPSSPPLCNGELCWTDNFVNKNYHEPVYAQLLNDHAALQKVYDDLRAKLESKTEGLEILKEGEETPKTDTKLEGGENAINLIMAEQIRALKEREAQLIWEAEELREQNDLMEFRILELEECRKEFLDKEVINEGKHRAEKIVWRERDIEEVSDSGVMSLPTSEDLTSDSELGEAIRNYSPLGAVTHLGLSTSENSHSDPVGIADLKLKKSLKSSECLQESGIFVDTESSSECAISPGTHTKSCQTESALDKTLLDIIDTSCDIFLSKNPGYLEDSKIDDLSTEISKLSVIQKKIEQKTSSPTPPRSPHTVHSCPHTSSLLFYEERLAQLEDKLKIYESSGDAKDVLLAKRLQKEVDLAHRVKELSDKVVSLEATNRKLEEEKCEFEEAENDTRFQCQRLEIRLQELIEKNSELELQVERQKVIMNEEKRRIRKKSNLDDLLQKYEERNYKMEDKDADAIERLSIIEAAMPAIVAYNVFKMVQNPGFNSPTSVIEPKDSHEAKNVAEMDSMALTSKMEKLDESFREESKMKKDYKNNEEKAIERELALKEKIQELETKATKDRETLEEMTNALKAYKSAEKPLRDDEIDLFEELKHMVENEIQLRTQIERLEKKEEAYMQSLEKADEIWAGMEAEYKRRLSEAEDVNKELQKKVSQLEQAQAALDKALISHPLQSDPPVPQEDIHQKIQELIMENRKLKQEFNTNLEEKFKEQRQFLEAENTSLRIELKKVESQSAKDESRYQLMMKELEMARQELRHEKELREFMQKESEEKSQGMSSMEASLQGQISQLTQELKQKSKELLSLEVTVAELREEVETLENKVGELVDTIQSRIKTEEEVTDVTQSNEYLLSLPVSEAVSHSVSVALSPSSEKVVATVIDRPVVSEILHKREVSLQSIDILFPMKFCVQYLVFVNPSYRLQEVTCLFGDSMSAYRILEKFAKGRVVRMDSVVAKETDDKEKEEEIFELSIRITDLLQTLERMEEETKMKDKEFEELQKIALEIRQEQRNFESLFDLKPKENDTDHPKRDEKEVAASREPQEYSPATDKNSSVDILKVINPIVVNGADQVSISLSSLQIAFDNLQGKHRSKTVMPKLLPDELKQKGDCANVEMYEKTHSEEENFEGCFQELPLIAEDERCVTNLGSSHKQRLPRPLGRSSSLTCPSLTTSNPKCNISKSEDMDSEFSYVAPITTLRKVGDDGIFLEWDVTKQPQKVTGFEIKVNGLLTHRVRSSTRNKALLRPLNLNEKVSIHLYAVTGTGRSTKSSHVTYPNDYFL